MATFLNLPAEIRNYIYDLSGCVMLYQCGRCTRMRRGDDHEDRCDLLVDDCHFFMFSPEYQCCRYDNTPSTHDGKSMNVCAGYHSVAFWVNRKSHLAKSAATIEGPKGKTNSNEKKKGHQKFLRSTSTCGMTCKPWDHGQGHVIEIAQPNVTRTCKQVRADTLPTFYGSHAFILTLFDIEEDAKSITSWLEMIGPANAGMLRNLKVVYRKKRKSHIPIQWRCSGCAD